MDHMPRHKTKAGMGTLDDIFSARYGVRISIAGSHLHTQPEVNPPAACSLEASK